MKSDKELNIQPPFYDSRGNLIEISFGYFTSIVQYTSNKRIPFDEFLQWSTNHQNKCIMIQHKGNELCLNQDCLEKSFVFVLSHARIHKIILLLKAPPRCYTTPQRRGQFRQRQLAFGMIDEFCLANNSAVCLQFNRSESINACQKFLIEVMQLDCHYAQINCIPMPNQTYHFNNIGLDFWSSYAFQMLLSVGYRVTRQITAITIMKIKQLSDASNGQQHINHPCYLKLTALYYNARHSHFFDINLAFDQIQSIPSGVIMEKWEYVPRIYLTPYGVYPLPIKPMRGNRILRERTRFGPPEHFCRVIIRDVDMGQPQQDFIKINEQWIKSLFIGNVNIPIGNHAFYFLLCSNSQLRDRSFWFYAPYGRCQAEHIRRWMGDFSHEQCVGARIARMALSLTGTTATIKVLKI